MLSERIGSSRKKIRYGSSAFASSIAWDGSRRVWTSTQISRSSPSSLRTASTQATPSRIAWRGSSRSPLRGQVEARELPALGLGRLAGVLQVGVQAVVAAVVRVADHLVADQPAEELVGRDAELLAADVPERDVHGRHRRADDAVGREEAAPEHQLPEVLDAAGVLADDLLADVIERAEDRLGPTVDAALADARDAGVRIDDAEEEVAVVDLDRERLDAGDLHENASLPTFSDRGTVPRGAAGASRRR